MLGSGVKSNSIPPVTYLHRSTTSKQPLLMMHHRSSLPRWSRVLIKNISQKCSRDDRKRTLGGLHGHGVVQTSGFGASTFGLSCVCTEYNRDHSRATQCASPLVCRIPSDNFQSKNHCGEILPPPLFFLFLERPSLGKEKGGKNWEQAIFQVSEPER